MPAISPSTRTSPSSRSRVRRGCGTRGSSPTWSGTSPTSRARSRRATRRRGVGARQDRAGMPAILELSTPTSTTWGVFLESFVIIVREGFEAILVLGAVVAFLIKTGQPRAAARHLVGRRRRCRRERDPRRAAEHDPEARARQPGHDRGRHDADRRRRAVLGELLAAVEGRVGEVAEVHPRQGERGALARRHLRARVRRVPRRVPRGRRDGAVLPGAVYARRRHPHAGVARPALGKRHARGDLHALLAVRAAAFRCVRSSP